MMVSLSLLNKPCNYEGLKMKCCYLDLKPGLDPVFIFFLDLNIMIDHKFNELVLQDFALLGH